MKPYYDDGQVTLYQGDVRAVLRELPADSVNCVVTSPPYWSLRDYGVEPTVWGEPIATTMNPCPHGSPETWECCHRGYHQWGETVEQQRGGTYSGKTRWQHIADEANEEGVPVRSLSPESWGLEDGHPAVASGSFCGRTGCGAWLGALGLEPTPELFVAHTVEVFREVRRVLRPDGTLWLNMGDSYAGSWGGASKTQYSRTEMQQSNTGSYSLGPDERPLTANPGAYGLKPKDLVGIPWMLAFALRADGWWLRQDIIWSKPNPMPESVRDRCTKAHEMLFLLSKSPRYYYNADAIREGVSEASVVAGANGKGESLVLGQDLGLEYAGAAFSAVCVRLAATVLDLAQRQNQLGLFALDAEVRQQGTDGGASLAVVHVPVVRRAAAEAARFADGDISAKQFLSEMDRLCVALPDGDDLKKTWRLAALHVGHIDSDGDGSVAIDNAGEVGKFKFIHNQQSTILGSGSSARRGLTGGAYSPPGQSPHGNARTDKQRGHSRRHEEQADAGRNKRSVWHIPTAPFPEAHFATFPPALVEPCILAGCPDGGVVLDPFVGSGTTAMVARQLGRRAIGSDLNPEYLAMAVKRVGSQMALLGEAAG